MRMTRMVGSIAVGLIVLAAATEARADGLLSRLLKRGKATESERHPAHTTPQSEPPTVIQTSQDVVASMPADVSGQANLQSSARPAPDSIPSTLEQLTLDQSLRIAETTQPQLAAASAAIDAARGRYRQAGTYPNPSLDVRGETLIAAEVVAGVSQPIILGDRRRRAMDAACFEIQTREREFSALRARVFWEVKQAFYEVLGLQQLLALARDQERNALTLVEKTQERFKQGDVAERDVLRAEVDLSTVRIHAENLERTLIEARKTLATRMGIAATTIDRCEGQLRLPERFGSEEDLTQQLLAAHPDLQAALSEVRFREAATAHARAERIPDASAYVLYRRLTETDQNTADVGILLPLPLFDRRTGRIQEVAAEASRARAQLAVKENDLLGQLRRSYESLLTYYRQADSYHTTILPKTDRSLELVRTAYDEGDASILEVLDAQRHSNIAHAAYLEVLAMLTQRWLEVEYLVQSQPRPTR